MTRPPLAYYGGKTRLAPAIVDLLPAHRHYVEPYAGSLAVLLAKPRAQFETVNDLDGDLVLFWRVLRDRGDDLARVCALTPHARGEYSDAQDLDAAATHPDPELERARRVWVVLSQGRGGTLRRTGWRYFRDAARRTGGMPATLNAYVDRMHDAIERLAGVSLECRDALDVVADYGAVPGACLYVDPPYVGSTRSAKNHYVHELRDDDGHRALAAALQACTAAVVLSGYPSPLYEELYAGWHRVDLPAVTTQGFRGGGDGYHVRTEVLWSNRPLRDPDLFDG